MFACKRYQIKELIFQRISGVKTHKFDPVPPNFRKWQVCLLLTSLSLLVAAQEDYSRQRSQMVQDQLIARDIHDPATLQAMEKIPRHLFVPGSVKERAYSDAPLPIGEGQTISQPYMVAFMTQTLNLKPNHSVLEIGTGSGYQAAVLAEIVDSVYTIEIIPSLGNMAKERLRSLGYTNIYLRIGDGYEGWPEKAPFDAIMVTAGAEAVPPLLLEQLKEGGRLLIPLGPHHGIRHLKMYHRKGTRYKERNLMAVRFVPLTRTED